MKTTVEPVRAGIASGITPEFVRTADVQRLLGLKKGTLYNLARAGRVKGVVLRVVGQKSGVRLWHLESIRTCILDEMAQQLAQPTPEAVVQAFSKVTA